MKSFARRFLKPGDDGVSNLLGLLLLLPVVCGMLWVAVYSLFYSLGGIGYLSKGWTVRFWQSAFKAPPRINACRARPAGSRSC